MKVHKLTDLNIDQNGLEVMDHLPAENPIALCYDETDRYVNGFIRWHWHPQPELVLSLTDFELHIADECIRLAPGEGIFINSGQLHMFRSPDDAPGAKSYTLLFAQEYIAPEGSLIFENCMRPIIDHPSLPYIISAVMTAGSPPSSMLFRSLSIFAPVPLPALSLPLGTNCVNFG